MSVYRFFLLPLVLLTFHFSMAQQASEDVLYAPIPQWELGVGLAAIDLPDYPGAEQSRTRYLPLPYFIYRGEVLRADREGGMRGRFFRGENWEFDLSFGAAFPARSEDNLARKGMPDLDWMGEIGPRALYHLYKGRMIKLDLSLPIRYVFSTDLQDYDFQGYVFEPEIKFRHRALFDPRAFFSSSFGPVWVTEDLADYFYEVSPGYVTSSRPVYDAQSGFMAWNWSLSYGRRFTDHITGVLGISKNFYKESDNRGSPLLQDIETESYFMGFIWVLKHSQATVGSMGGDS